MSASKDAIARAAGGPGDAARLDQLWLAERRASDRFWGMHGDEHFGDEPYTGREWDEAGEAMEAAEQAREREFPGAGFPPAHAEWWCRVVAAEREAAASSQEPPRTAACPNPHRRVGDDALREELSRHWSDDTPAAHADGSGWEV